MKRVTIFLAAGEPSGDFLGARLMQALKKAASSTYEIKFVGIGGPLMSQEGLESLFPMQELSLMGIFEILPHLFHLRKRLHQTLDFILATQPDVVVTIDSPGFNLRLARLLRERTLGTEKKIPLIHYVAPSVWAWRKKRAERMVGIFDHLLTLLPFEPPYFEKVGLPATFVGHSVVEGGINEINSEAFRATYNIPAEAPLLCVLPGSRKNELKKLLPIFEQTVLLLSHRVHNLHVVIPTLESLKDSLQEALQKWPVPVTLITGLGPKYQAFKASTAALAASGTVTLELALARLPMVVAYKINPLTAWVLKRLLKTPYVCLVNIILKKRSVPEILQEDCKPKRLAEVLSYLLEESPARVKQVKDLKEVAASLTKDKIPPSERAAEVVLGYLQK